MSGTVSQVGMTVPSQNVQVSGECEKERGNVWKCYTHVELLKHGVGFQCPVQASQKGKRRSVSHLLCRCYNLPQFGNMKTLNHLVIWLEEWFLLSSNN